ncbi:MAG: efflux RND transporter periplasmic adaptor subunit [Deltaproteobacteria bacterium]|nr:efflux RND transporter periplasmic adaptor subunit [Deltaproteobacteria bacterium]
MRRGLWLLSGILLLLAGGAALYLHFAKAPSTPGKPAATAPAPVVERIPVKVAYVEKRDLEVPLAVFGSINYLEKVDVASELSGVVKDVPVQVGDLVRPGQVVAILDTDLLQAELKTKAALKAQAQAQLRLAAWQYQAQKKVHKVGGISLKDMEEAEARYHAVSAEVERFQAEMAQIQTQIRKATITSPITGVVAQKNFNRGERVTSQTEKGVVTLMQVDEVYAEAEVNERDLARLRPGLDAVVYPDAYPKSPQRGRIERLDPVLKTDSRSVVAKVRLNNPQLLLRPGMFTRIEIVLDKIPQAVAAPQAALRQAPDKTWQVFVIADEVAFLRKVTTGHAAGGWVEITQGLQPGDAVVVEGAERLRDLSRVISSLAGPGGP